MLEIKVHDHMSHAAAETKGEFVLNQDPKGVPTPPRMRIGSQTPVALLIGLRGIAFR
jgi:hypothetical protein